MSEAISRERDKEIGVRVRTKAMSSSLHGSKFFLVV
jgi:hypothetical protein